MEIDYRNELFQPCEYYYYVNSFIFKSNYTILLKYLVILFAFVLSSVYAQDYVDVLKIGYSNTFKNDFTGTTQSTDVRVFETNLTYPMVIDENNALITGIDFASNRLQLFPNSEFTSLYTATLKIGLAKTFNEKWSGTFVFLPKIASDYRNITRDDFYVGGYSLLKLKKKENLIYRFGIYGSTEAFGFFTTPIFGWYYLSPSKRFEMDVSLPVAVDINYRVGAVTLGVDYMGIGRSFNVNPENSPKVYADVSSLDFATYTQFNFVDDSVLLRAKLGYSSNNYEVYTDGDKIDLGLSAFSFGDDRTQLNPDINGSLFFKLEAIYRFKITDTQ